MPGMYEELFAKLVKAQVEFVVAGGVSAVLQGAPIATFDVDLCYRRTAANLRKLADALRDLGPTLRGAPPDLPFRIDAEALALGANYTFRTRFGDLDLLGYVEPFGDYDELNQRSTTERVGDLDLKVAALDDLIRIKQHLGRPKDRDSLLHLLAIKRVREEAERGA